MAVLGMRRSGISCVLLAMHATMIVCGMIVRNTIGMRHRRPVHMRGGDRSDLISQARKRRSECKRNRRHENAKQIGQDDETPRPHPP